LDEAFRQNGRNPSAWALFDLQAESFVMAKKERENAMFAETETLTQSPVQSQVRGWIDSIAPSETAGFTRIVLRGNRVLTPLLISDSLVGEHLLTQESVVGLTIETANDALPASVVAITVHSRAQALPVDLKSPDLSDLEHRHLHIRAPQLRATAMFRHHIQRYAREYLEAQDFIQVQTPVLTKASSVSSGTVFDFPLYDDHKAVLTQSNWMSCDALVNALERVYAIGPTFRREDEATTTHLVEIWQICIDMAWASNEELMDVQEGMLRHISRRLRDNHADLYELAGLSATHLADFDKPFARISYADSIKRLADLGHSMVYGDDYSREQSKVLSASYDRPYFVTCFPEKLKNFWFEVDQDGLTPTSDLYAHTGHGEIIGGGQRTNDVALVISNLEKRKYDVEKFNWIVDVRRYGCVPHAGCSLGFDRMVSMFMGADHIRDAVLFPREPLKAIRP
jgi:asparaginyl-tRNA synthetase